MRLDQRDESRLRDMVLWSRKAISILGEIPYMEFLGNEEKRLALVRCVEVIGEAAHGVSGPVKAELPTIPWHAAYGMRNRLIHDYGNTNDRVVFDVIRDDLPGMYAILEAFLNDRGIRP